MCNNIASLLFVSCSSADPSIFSEKTFQLPFPRSTPLCRRVAKSFWRPDTLIRPLPMRSRQSAIQDYRREEVIFKLRPPWICTALATICVPLCGNAKFNPLRGKGADKHINRTYNEKMSHAYIVFHSCH